MSGDALPAVETPRLTRGDFSERLTSTTSRATVSASLPLVQRKFATNVPTIDDKTNSDVHEIQHVVEPEPRLPLVTKQTKSDPTVQREREGKQTSASPAAPGQPVATGDDEEERQPPAPVDLDNLAREIYPIIKRMLAIERERYRGF
jgi:hypothetical protein